MGVLDLVHSEAPEIMQNNKAEPGKLVHTTAEARQLRLITAARDRDEWVE